MQRTPNVPSLPLFVKSCCRAKETIAWRDGNETVESRLVSADFT
jgi:hypothetical protein